MDDTKVVTCKLGAAQREELVAAMIDVPKYVRGPVGRISAMAVASAVQLLDRYEAAVAIKNHSSAAMTALFIGSKLHDVHALTIAEMKSLFPPFKHLTNEQICGRELKLLTAVEVRPFPQLVYSTAGRSV